MSGFDKCVCGRLNLKGYACRCGRGGGRTNVGYAGAANPVDIRKSPIADSQGATAKAGPERWVCKCGKLNKADAARCRFCGCEKSSALADRQSPMAKKKRRGAR